MQGANSLQSFSGEHVVVDVRKVGLYYVGTTPLISAERALASRQVYVVNMPPEILRPSKALAASLTMRTHAARGGGTLETLKSDVDTRA